jgi:MFS family permease
MLRTPAPQRRSAAWLLVAALASASFLQWIGASTVLPLLPLYLQGRGSSAGLIGAVMAAYFAGAVVAQYAAGRLGDRIGHRAVLVAGLLGYAAASAGFLADLDGTGYLMLRAAQGAAAGSAQVAMLALVASAVPASAHGRAFSAVYGAELAGVAIGPLLGTLVGVSGMGKLFVVAAAAAVLACLPVLFAGRRTAANQVAASEPVDGGPAPRARLDWTGRRGQALTGVMLAAIVGGAVTGVYEACWTLLLHHRGAQPWQIGASWTLFAVPFVVASPVAGWLADHYDRRVLVVVALVTSLGFAALYPFLTSLPWLIGLGAIESVGVAVATPAAQAMLASAVPSQASGQAMGLFASIQTAAIAVYAGVAGSLFGIGPWVPFVTAAVLGAVLTATVAVVWRGVPGRTARDV